MRDSLIADDPDARYSALDQMDGLGLEDHQPPAVTAASPARGGEDTPDAGNLS